MNPARRGVVLGLVLVGSLSVASPAQACTPIPSAQVFLLHDTSYPELLSIPGVSDLAARGGTALLANADDLVSQAQDLAEHPPVGPHGAVPKVQVVDLGTAPSDAAAREAFLRSAGERLATDGALDGDGAVVVATVGDPGDGGVLNGLVIGWPRQDAASSAPGVLTSGSTRRAGLVTGSDLKPTVMLLACGSGSEVQGAIVGPLASTEYERTPGEILARHLDVRHIAFPIQVGALIATLIISTIGLFTFFRRSSLPGWALTLGLWCCLAVPVLAVSLLMAGHLPTMGYAQAVPAVVVPTLILPGLFLAAGRHALFRPLIWLGVVLLAVMAFEAFAGWGATPYTLLGGTALDGARYYGLPNAFIGIVMGSCLYLAAVMPRWSGLALVFAGCMLVGLPSLGANLGGAITLAAASGVWAVLTGSGSRRWAEGAVLALGGVGVVIGAHVLADAPTHVTRFVAEGGVSGGPLAALADRLMTGVRLLQRSPFGLLYLAGTPLLLWLVLRPRGGMVDVFERYPRWRWAMLTILTASVVAYFVNDTGVAAVGQGFALALGGTLFVPLARQRGKMGPA